MAQRQSAWRNMAGLLGPAMLVSVGYMDPGNWATDLEGGVRFGYGLLWVLVLSNAMAWLLQTLCFKLGSVGALDLASACRAYYSKPMAVSLWLLAEIAIIACDLAELLGSAVALNLLFGIPMLAGALLTAFDVLVIFAIQRKAPRVLERIVAGMLLTVAACLAVELFLVKPDAAQIVTGFVPKLDDQSLYVAIGILGATVMPHNLYLHSALSPRVGRQISLDAGRRLLRAGTFSTGLALNAALFLNAAILILAAAAFSNRGIAVHDLHDAHRLLAPLVGTGLASVLFAVGLLCAGQSSTITGTLAGQVVMEGFLHWRVSPLVRRAITRGLALIPAVTVLALVGPSGTMTLLIASQVVLSLQLPFAVVPLLRFTSSRDVMGAFVNGRAARFGAGAAAAIVVAANAALILRLAQEWQRVSPALGYGLGGLAVASAIGLSWIALVPLRRSRGAALSSPSVLSGERDLAYRYR